MNKVFFGIRVDTPQSVHDGVPESERFDIRIRSSKDSLGDWIMKRAADQCGIEFPENLRDPRNVDDLWEYTKTAEYRQHMHKRKKCRKAAVQMGICPEYAGSSENPREFLAEYSSASENGGWAERKTGQVEDRFHEAMAALGVDSYPSPTWFIVHWRQKETSDACTIDGTVVD